MRKLYDISEVCGMLGTTSRALRFYEAEGLIQSTTEPPSRRRKYTEEQIDAVKNILALRALGLSVKVIKELAKEKNSVKDAIALQRAELFRSVVEKQTQINLLDEVLHGMEGSQESMPQILSSAVCTKEQLKIAEECTNALLCEKFAVITEHFSEDLKILLPESALAHSFKATVSPLGKFVRREKPRRHEPSPNIVICLIKYEAMTLRVKYVFHGNLIYGLWTDYTE